MKRMNYTSALAALLLVWAMSACQKPATQEETATAEVTPNTLTDEEKAAGWELLFDGSSFGGWKRYNHDTIGPLWSIKEGVIICDGSGLGEGSGNMGGSLTTTRTFGNFELSVEWKISPGGNSGILYHVVESPEYGHDYETGPEYQVMDDAGWKGGELKAAQKVGSNYDMFEAPETKRVMPVGEWNTSRIVYNNGHVEHYLNGEKTVEFEEGSEEFTKRYQSSKWVDFPGWNKSKVGAISLQDHGAPVYYRSIKIRTL
jgi:Domain of Unknown Function (DUF1080)